MLACRLSPVVVLLACAGGGGGSGLAKDQGNLDTNNTNNSGGSVYDYQTPVSKKPPVLQAASYPLNWDGNTPVTPPKVSPTESVYEDGTKVVRDGSAQKPFLQSELNAAAITDPNAVVRSVSKLSPSSAAPLGQSTGYLSPAGISSNLYATDYDLRWGTPDPKGPVYAQLYANGDWRPAQPLYFWGQKLSGQGCLTLCGPNIGQPAPEVIDAWKLGWTGKGVNVLIEDFLYFYEGAYHGVITSLLAYRYAPGATPYGLNIGADQQYHSIVDLSNKSVPSLNSTPIKLGVVNASYEADLSYLTNQSSGWTEAQLLQARIDNAPTTLLITNRFQNTSYKGQVNYTDAVITKAAGNDKLRSDQEPINKGLTDIPSISNRLLIVGALSQAGDVNNPVNIASYSNTAGTDPAVNSRYLLASGTTPFGNGDLAVNGLAINSTNSYYSNAGTSYAAPRVAGMVAIVRSKFLNLNASQTASIMLDTARYDTLTCKTAAACDKTIYGRGEASLSRALAPVGKLR